MTQHLADGRYSLVPGSKTACELQDGASRFVSVYSHKAMVVSRHDSDSVAVTIAENGKRITHALDWDEAALLAEVLAPMRYEYLFGNRPVQYKPDGEPQIDTTKLFEGE